MPRPYSLGFQRTFLLSEFGDLTPKGSESDKLKRLMHSLRQDFHE